MKKIWRNAIFFEFSTLDEEAIRKEEEEASKLCIFIGMKLPRR